MHLLYASHLAAGKPSMVFVNLVYEKNDPLWLNTRIHASVRHNKAKKIRENFPEYFV